MANGFANLWALEMEKCGLELEPTNFKSCTQLTEHGSHFSLKFIHKRNFRSTESKHSRKINCNLVSSQKTFH